MRDSGLTPQSAPPEGEFDGNLGITAEEAEERAERAAGEKAERAAGEVRDVVQH
jgi:hypothetical protein